MMHSHINFMTDYNLYFIKCYIIKKVYYYFCESGHDVYRIKKKMLYW